MNKSTPAAILASVLVAASASAQDLGIKAPPQSRPIAIKNATIHPISSEPIAGGIIVFDKGVIVALGPADKVDLPSGTEVIDAKGKHVYPGLISSYSQLGLTEFPPIRQTVDSSETGNVTPEARAVAAINPDSTLLPVTRASGVLVGAIFPTGGTISGQVAIVNFDGWTWEEMAITQNAGLSINWPNARPITAWWNTTPRDEQVKRIREQLQSLSDTFLAAAAYRDHKPDQSDIRLAAMQDILPAQGESRVAQKPVFIRASDADQISQSIAWAIERNLRPIIVGGRDARLCVELLKKHDVPVIVLNTHSLPKRDDSAYEEGYTLPRDLQSAGVRWSLACGDDTAHERNLAHHAASGLPFGLSPDDAIRGITLSAAQILGVDNSIGSLAPGKAATLIVTTETPLELTSSVTSAFINGRSIDLSSKHTKLNEKYRERYKQMGLIRE